MLAMWKCKEQTANSKQQTAGGCRLIRWRVAGPRPSSGLLLFTVCCMLFATSCRRDMQDQPKMKPYRSTVFFKDGLSTRPPIEGTVARGFLKTDTEFFTGKKAGKTAGSPSAMPAQTPAGPQPAEATRGAGVSASAPQGPAAYPD